MRPYFGNDVRIFNDQDEPCKPGELGRIMVKLPMPPSFMSTLWKADDLFRQKYMSEIPGYYFTGDAGVIDDKGMFHIMTRIDDVINTAGHRISTGRIEEVMNEHPMIAESAVVAFNDSIKGEMPLAFVVLFGKLEDIPA